MKIDINDIRKLIKQDFVTRNCSGLDLLLEKLDEIEDRINLLEQEKQFELLKNTLGRD